MKINSSKSLIDSYYLTNKEQLLLSYPGLSAHRLLDEFTTYSNSVSESEYDVFFDKLSKGVPLEYINKKAFFFEHEFYVDERVLIPRSETEILVEKAREHMAKNDVKAICEVGVGSGALLFSILAGQGNNLISLAVDIDEAALEVSKLNLKKFTKEIRSKVKFLKNDRLDGIDIKFDLIVSNPPYIKEEMDMKSVHQQVQRYEPRIALYITDDLYNEWFDTFFTQVENCLVENGLFIMEGHEDHLEGLLESSGWGDRAHLIKDYTRRNRFLVFKK